MDYHRKLPFLSYHSCTWSLLRYILHLPLPLFSLIIYHNISQCFFHLHIILNYYNGISFESQIHVYLNRNNSKYIRFSHILQHQSSLHLRIIFQFLILQKKNYFFDFPLLIDDFLTLCNGGIKRMIQFSIFMMRINKWTIKIINRLVLFYFKTPFSAYHFLFIIRFLGIAFLTVFLMLCLS